MLLAASLVFYSFTGWVGCIFMGVTALSTWLAGLSFARLDAKRKADAKKASSRDEKKAIKKRCVFHKRIVLALVLLVNLGMLAYVKYANGLVSLIAPGSNWKTGLLLPLGISFYTFQSISYVIDTYNSKSKPQGNFFKHLLFVSYFPQLTQGPINRYDALGEQLCARHSFDWQQARGALVQIGYGALKKYVVADMLVEAVDAIFNNIQPDIPGSLVVLGVLLYGIYQYADFSGGIDMVLGFSRLFGINMAENFRQPYFAVSLGDFWRRWHISLGAWMRDYVFYPLALTSLMKRWTKWLTTHLGRHIGRTLPACVANIVVFFLVGLWHGADSHFILWGLYNGIVIAASDLLAPLWERLNTRFHTDMQHPLHHVGAILRTFVIVNIGWYFDRIEGVGNLATCFGNTLFNFAPGRLLPEFKAVFLSANAAQFALSLLPVLLIFYVSLRKERGHDVEGEVLALHPVLRGLLYGVVIVLIGTSFMYVSGGGFMYANF